MIDLFLLSGAVISGLVLLVFGVGCVVASLTLFSEFVYSVLWDLFPRDTDKRNAILYLLYISIAGLLITHLSGS